MQRSGPSTEICGYFVKDSGNTLKIQQYSEGIMDNGRHMCRRHGTPTKYRWHTHPSNAKFYPSEEDIHSVIKHGYYSYIFTPIGYWTLCFHEGNKRTQKLSKRKRKRKRKNRKSAKALKSTNKSPLQIIKSINKTLLHEALDYRTIRDSKERLDVAKDHMKQPLIHKYESALMKEFPGLYVMWTLL